MTRGLGLVGVPLLTLTVGCTAGPPSPAALDTRHQMCGTCQMIVSDPHTASQIVAPDEEPQFFDDLVCLRRYREAHGLPPGAVVYVADHRTGDWVGADAAVYTRRLRTGAMGGDIIAHASAASRDADAAASGGSPVAAAEAIGAAAGGTR